jgi:hypothetical protein
VHVDHRRAVADLDDGAVQAVRLAQEVRDVARDRPLVELARRAQLLDPPGVHDRDGVGHRHGLLLVVRDVHERAAHPVLDPLELQLHLPAQLEVERPERLVEQQHLGLVDEGAGHRHALLLTAGQLAGLAAAEALQLHQRQHVGDRALDVLDAAAPQPEGDVVLDAQVREQRVALEHRVHRPLVRPQGADVLVAEQHLPRRRSLEPGDHPQRRGLAAAGRAEQGEERPRGDRQVEVVDRDEVAERLAQPAQPEVARGPARRVRHR